MGNFNKSWKNDYASKIDFISDLRVTILGSSNLQSLIYAVCVLKTSVQFSRMQLLKITVNKI